MFSCRRKRKHGKIWNNARFARILISVAVRFISCLNITIMIAANIIRVKVTSHLIILNSDVISLFCALIDIFFRMKSVRLETMARFMLVSYVDMALNQNV